MPKSEQSERLRAIAAELGLNHAECARLLGVSHYLWMLWHQGRGAVPSDLEDQLRARRASQTRQLARIDDFETAFAKPTSREGDGLKHRIARFCRATKWSDQQCADHLGVHVSTWRLWKRGLRTTQPQNARKLEIMLAEQE